MTVVTPVGLYETVLMLFVDLMQLLDPALQLFILAIDFPHWCKLLVTI